jgi:hypothetical protein
MRRVPDGGGGWYCCSRIPAIRAGPQWAGGADLGVTDLDGQLGGMSQPFEWPVRRGSKAS